MTKKQPNIVVLGDGGWGTTLAILLSRKGFKVTLWGAFADYTQELIKRRENKKFLPGIKIPSGINISADLKNAIEGKDIVILAIPSEYIRSVLKKIKLTKFSSKTIFVSVTKGIETVSLKRISELIHQELGVVKLVVLSGPTIAYEVAREIPTTAVVSSTEKQTRKYIQDIFMTERFRIYTNDDVTGVELGGSLKNIIAIACGISDGLGFGTNATAALLSRGLAEISRLGLAMGAKKHTFSGLSGLGDLVTTCMSKYSRNRFVGEQIGKGKALREIKEHMQMVAEGVPTTASAYKLAKKYKVEMPITNEVYNVLYKNKSALDAVKDLMTRKGKEE